jgi:hypothetical protein
MLAFCLLSFVSGFFGGCPKLRHAFGALLELALHIIQLGLG